MRWKQGRESQNVEDRRGMRGPVMIGGGLGTLVLVLLVLALGGNPQALLQQQQQNPNAGGIPGNGAPAQADPAEEELKRFVSVVLADTEDVWSDLFRDMGRQYQVPKLVLFSDRVDSACGFASAATGPFYCPADEKVYLDMSFFGDLHDRFGAPGDFARAYVIAHEVGHHVQNQLGISQRVQQMRNQLSETKYNQVSVRLELQADFFAGVWAHHAQQARHILEAGDIEEGLRAASAIGDDTLQMETQGYVVPDAFTHGTAEQRVRWFRRGLQSGDVSQGDTFNADPL